MKIKLKVLFLPKWYPYEGDPLDGNFVENHAHAVKQICDLTVLFVHSSNQQQKTTYRFEEKDNQGIRELRVYFKKANTPFGILNRLINFKRYSKAQKKGYQHLYPDQSPDLLHIHVLARSSMLALEMKKKGIPFVISEHWSGYLPESRALRKSGKTLWYRMIGLKANAIHTVSSHLAQAMKAHSIKNNYTIIPNVVKEELFKPIEKAAAEKKKILYVGNILQHPKRILDIIDVFHQLSKKRDDFCLDIYGEGKDLNEMQAKIDQYELNDIIQYKGTRDRAGIAKVMGQADFLFLFSEFENQPCVINEALCCGMPVVVPNIEGIVEFMKDDYGLVFQRNNQAEFLTSLEKMMDKHQDYNRRKIREMAVAQFGEAAIAQQFLSFYQSALAQ